MSVKNVLCYYNKYKTCTYGDTCAYAHDINEIINNCQTHLKIIFEQFTVNINVKMMLINTKNNIVVPDNIKFDIFNIIILMSLINVLREVSPYIYVNQCDFLNSVISTEYYDIEYIKCMLILYISQSNECPNNIIYNNDMFRLIILDRGLKHTYALKMLYFLKYKRTSNNLYNFIKLLNEETLKMTYNYDVKWTGCTLILNQILLLNNNINFDKSLIKYIVKNHNNIDFLVSNMDIKFKQNHKFILELIDIKQEVLKHLNINMYVSNLEIIRHILLYDITKYYILNGDAQKNKKIVSIACNIKKKKIPYNVVLSSYCDYIRFKIIKKLRNDIIIDKISRFLLDHSGKYNSNNLHYVRMQELYNNR